VLGAPAAAAQSRLNDAQAELRTSEQRCQLEKGRVAELEALLTGLRAREYQADSSSQRSGSQLGAVQERNKALEEQVGCLPLWRIGAPGGCSELQRPLVRCQPLL
jgi:chromosome segregation ATPase